MSSAVKGPLSSRYVWAKLMFAGEEFLHTLINPKLASTATTSGQQVGTGILAKAMARFREAYNERLTMTMYIAGAAMCPSLNKEALKDPSAVERLIVRLLKRPSAANVWVGDVVAFVSPLGKPSERAVMVRRVAAVEGQEMVSEGDAEEEGFVIPKDHCWVLADNPDMKPPQVIDSRTFGHIPLSNITGRVIYAGSSPTEHGPVVNSPTAQAADDPILEQEVLLAGLFTKEDESSGEGDK